MDLIEEARKVLKIEADALSALAGRLDGSFELAVELIHAGTSRVIVCGMGKSGIVGKKIAATLASTGTPAFFLHPAEASHGDLGMVTSKDVVLAISNSGETEELVALIPFIKRFGVKLVSMTGNRSSALARASDVHLDVSVHEEACPMGLVPTASTTAALAMGDALAVVLLLRKGFKKEDFAVFHPRGSLGKRLLVRVKDLMHAEGAVPRVSPDTKVKDAVIEMSSKRLGVTTVIGEDGALMGIISDGDLRRGIQKWGTAFFGMNSIEVMSASPKTLDEDSLAVNALAIMEKHEITSILAVDGGGRVSGVLHIHDILKEGIA